MNNIGVYLNVPFLEKDRAKRLGAWWDHESRRWFVPRGTDPAPFSKWFIQHLKVKALEILVARAEGPHDMCFSAICYSFKAANALLSYNAETASESGGYDKHDVTITFEDGETYEARIDVYHPTKEKFERIEDHVRDHCTFYGGLLTASEIPSHLTWDQYLRFQETISDEQRKDYKHFLDTYKLED